MNYLSAFDVLDPSNKCRFTRFQLFVIDYAVLLGAVFEVDCLFIAHLAFELEFFV